MMRRGSYATVSYVSPFSQVLDNVQFCRFAFPHGHCTVCHPNGVVRYAKINLTVLYTKTGIVTSKDRSHRDTVAHIDIKLNKLIKRGF